MAWAFAQPLHVFHRIPAVVHIAHLPVSQRGSKCGCETRASTSPGNFVGRPVFRPACLEPAALEEEPGKVSEQALKAPEAYDG